MLSACDERDGEGKPEAPRTLALSCFLFLLFLGGDSVPTMYLVLYAYNWLVERQETGKDGPSFRGTWYS